MLYWPTVTTRNIPIITTTSLMEMVVAATGVMVVVPSIGVECLGAEASVVLAAPQAALAVSVVAVLAEVGLTEDSEYGSVGV